MFEQARLCKYSSPRNISRLWWLVFVGFLMSYTSSVGQVNGRISGQIDPEVPGREPGTTTSQAAISDFTTWIQKQHLVTRANYRAEQATINHEKLRASGSAADSTRLPFSIADEKRLSDEDLADKKEGFYVTGLPDFFSDPVNGIGYGAEAELFFNGKRSDPFFAYTPYRSRIAVSLSNTTRNQRAFGVNYDVPYAFNSKWRLRLDLTYGLNPNQLYFGVTPASLSPLKHPGTGLVYGQFNAYQAALNQIRPTANGPVTDHYYNSFTSEEGLFNISGERTYADGKVRLLLGFELAALNVTPYDGVRYARATNPVNGAETAAVNGPTLLQQDATAGRIRGLGKTFMTLLQTGLCYDTRDLETDPGRGSFIELTNELSLKSLGSTYNFDKVFLNARFYQRLLPNLFGKLVLAGRLGIGYTAGSPPFFEYLDQWSSEADVSALGGGSVLRGYKQNRFVSQWLNFATIELRARFAQTDLLKQHFAFSAVPFFDVGNVAVTAHDLFHSANYRVSPGLGLRIAWNVNTIIRLDYAVSREDKQVFINLGHAF